LPAIIGAVNINSNTGTVSFGDSINVSPKNAFKTFSGSGGSNTGNVVNTVSGTSVTNIIDPSAIDQPITGNV